MEANGIAEEDLMPELKEQAEQMAMQQQQAMPNPEMQAQQQAMMPDQTMDQDQAMYAQGQQQFPEQMPSGAPVATPQNTQPMQPGMGQEQMMPPQGPMAMYGMEMGGYGMPFYNDPNQMAYGGVPKFVPGGPTGPGNGVTVNNIPANRTPTAPTGTGWTAGTPVGATGQNPQGWSRTTRQPGQSVTYHSGSRMGTEQGVAQGICAKIAKSGNVEEAILNAFPAYLKGKRPGMAGYDEAMAAAVAKLSANPLYKDCIKAANEKFETKEALYLDETAPEQDCPPCIDPATGQPAVDASGQPILRTKDPVTGKCSECTETVQSKKCQCKDPNTGEVKVFDIAQEEECVCEELIQGQGQGVRRMDPHWTKNAQANVLSNALMDTSVAPQNTVVPGRAQTKGAFEEYQTKVDQGLAGIANMQNAIMYGMSGSTGMKQAAMKDALGVGLRASMDAVAGVQSRNVDRQRDTNDKSAAIDNANMMARNAVQNQGLQLQAANQNQRTANKNKRNYNTTRAVMDANNEMRDLYNIQTTTPQYGADYDYGMVYNTGVPKTPNPLGGGASMDAKVKEHMRNGATYEKAYDLALREARLNTARYGGNFADGGFLYGDVTFPFLM